jgi:tetratricopeptide (TPR) repeat protein
LVILSALVVLGWAIREFRPASVTLFPLTPSPQPTATPTATPTPSVPERVAEQISQLHAAWDRRDWPVAIDHLARISVLDHEYPGLSDAQCDTYLHWAQELEQSCQFERAHDLYRQAFSACPDREGVSQLKERAFLYLSGKWRYDRERWVQAAQALQRLYELQPDYAAGCQEPLVDADAETSPPPLKTDVHALLRNSLEASSSQHLERGRLEQALDAAERALALAPDDQTVVQLRDTIERQLLLGKRIEVSISEQRMYVYHGEILIYDWECSTGKPNSGTATGRYRVQSKIPEAWGGQWSLRMPYWLGIYWVGSIENGIHALPIMANGETLWEGYLGTPVSFGCIILSTENARTLYDWAEIGTPVWIHH